MCLAISVHALKSIQWVHLSEAWRGFKSENLFFSHSTFILSGFMSLVRTWKSQKWSWRWSEGKNVRRTQADTCHFLVSLLVLKPYAVSSRSSENSLDHLPWRSYRISGNSFTKSPTSIWIEGVSSNAMMSARWTITLSNQEEVDSWEKKKTECWHFWLKYFCFNLICNGFSQITNDLVLFTAMVLCLMIIKLTVL